MPIGCGYTHGYEKLVSVGRWQAGYYDINGKHYSNSELKSEAKAQAFSPNGACPKGYTEKQTTSTSMKYYDPPCDLQSSSTIYNCDLNSGLSNGGLRIDMQIPIIIGGLPANSSHCGLFYTYSSSYGYFGNDARIGSLCNLSLSISKFRIFAQRL